jgi:hypothetical protein
MTPFDYPPRRPRRHGPRGYRDYARFLPWLRDEFDFRCVHCLAHEQWIVRLGGFAVEHFAPVAAAPELALSYDNLLYACNQCNSAKRTLRIPDPLQTLTAETISVSADGHINGRTADARSLIDKLGLDDPSYVRFRRNWIEIIQLTAEHDPRFHDELSGYPDDLPDLSRLRPPGGNSRPKGIEQSHFARRERGQLQPTA